MSNLIQFKFESHEIRTLTDEQNENWFVLRDVLQAMGTTTRPAIAKDDIEQGLGRGYTMNTPLQTTGGIQQATIINEAAVTFLVARSNTEIGKRLNRWIHTEVLPSIRKTGKYEAKSNQEPTKATPQEISSTAKAMISMAKAFGFKGNQAILSADKATTRLIGVSPIQLMGAELVSETKKALLTPTEIGKQINLSSRKVNEHLEKMGLQKSYRGTHGELKWELTDKGKQFAEVFDTGKRHSDGVPVKQIKWQSEIVESIGAR